MKVLHGTKRAKCPDYEDETLAWEVDEEKDKNCDDEEKDKNSSGDDEEKGENANGDDEEKDENGSDENGSDSEEEDEGIDEEDEDKNAEGMSRSGNFDDEDEDEEGDRNNEKEDANIDSEGSEDDNFDENELQQCADVDEAILRANTGSSVRKDAAAKIQQLHSLQKSKTQSSGDSFSNLITSCQFDVDNTSDSKMKNLKTLSQHCKQPCSSQLSTVRAEINRARAQNNLGALCHLYIIVPKRRFGGFVKMGRTGGDPSALITRYNTAYGRVEITVCPIVKRDDEEYEAYIIRTRKLEAELFDKVSSSFSILDWNYFSFFVFSSLKM